MKELAKTYNPKEFEKRIYEEWKESDAFVPDENAPNPSFTIVMPPPNVTGVLHMGHGLQSALQDTLTRYYRMQGFKTLWIPGTDHAGIATQNVVEKRLREQGVERESLGREKFLEETWKVKEEHHAVIRKQIEALGSSCDWDHERFTLDETLSEAVREVFVTLYERDLLYRGEYLVNWCSRCGTALSDDEVEHKENEAKLYTIQYESEDGRDVIQIATTRPETIFGDVAIAVNPEDPRYTSMIGKSVRVPLTDRFIPIIADPHSNPELGTGAVKITPSHDHNDYEVGLRHKLPHRNILNRDGTLNENVPEIYRGLDVSTGRKRVLAALEESGEWRETEKQLNNIGRCYRCSTIIEPYLSTQWFVRMKPMAEKALNAWEKGEVVFYPKKWENTYRHWLENIRDWCISRQLWWGHQIPVYYCNSCGKMHVSREVVLQCLECGSKELTQDPDVLDTWFSSWLWPFSTLGWPEKSSDMEKFFPTSTLVTGYDILFFWVARMIMASLEFLGEVPFKDVYLTPLIRDKKGRKMSKSLGNGIDPLEIVDEYGADSLKFTLAFLSSQGEDIPLDKEMFKLGSKFCNKVWNASRYLLMNLDESLIDSEGSPTLSTLDQWMYHQLNEGIKVVEKSFQNYRFDEAAKSVYTLFWNDFCDWYLECSKPSLYSEEREERARITTVLYSLLKEFLALLHPFIPLLSESIYQNLPNLAEGTESLMASRYPQADAKRENPELALSFTRLQELVQNIRTIRSEFTIAPKKEFPVTVVCDEKEETLFDYLLTQKNLIETLTRTEITVTKEGQSDSLEGSLGSAGRGFSLHLFVRSEIDSEKEIVRLKKQLEKAKKERVATQKKLQNEKFTSRAPAEIIQKEEAKLVEFEETITKVSQYLEGFL